MDLSSFISISMEHVHTGRITPQHTPFRNPKTSLRGERTMWAGLHHGAAFQEDVNRAANRVRLHSASEKCRPLPEPPVRRWGITALVTAACATSHMIPTIPPLFRKSNWKGTDANGKKGDSDHLLCPQNAETTQIESMRGHRHPSSSRFLLLQIHLDVSHI